jgi:RNA polymerase sigma factor (TIGR02999 family)
MTASETITDLLARWPEGPEIHSRVMPLVYADLRHLASCLFAKERRDHTLQATDLVGEAYIRLVNSRSFKNRAHFFGAAANIMRWKLMDYARRRKSARRWGTCERVELDEQSSPAQKECGEILAMGQALRKLETLNRRQAELVKLRYFTGLSVQEAAEVLKISVATAKNDWFKARTWLKEQLEV